MKIAILDTKKAYLPEINAYINYFKKKGIDAKRVYKEDLNDISEYDVIWKFAGIDTVGYKEGHVIHEYNSLTTGNLRWIKDKLKKQINVKPAARVFLNKEVKDVMNFNDNVPSFIRDMGIAKEFFMQSSHKEYDFVYIGAMDENRMLDKILHSFKGVECNKNILMIGKPNNNLYNQFKETENIIFTGALKYEEIPQIASKAIYGLNYIPDVYPYNNQTSTKLLEYCALGLNIVTTDYSWVRKFENQENAHFYKINKNKVYLNFDDISKFEYNTPDVMKYEWDRVLEQSKLLEFLNEIEI